VAVHWLLMALARSAVTLGCWARCAGPFGDPATDDPARPKEGTSQITAGEYSLVVTPFAGRSFYSSCVLVVSLSALDLESNA